MSMNSSSISPSLVALSTSTTPLPCSSLLRITVLTPLPCVRPQALCQLERDRSNEAGGAERTLEVVVRRVGHANFDHVLAIDEEPGVEHYPVRRPERKSGRPSVDRHHGGLADLPQIQRCGS